MIALLSKPYLFQRGAIPTPASRFMCEHLLENFFRACISRIHAQVPVITTGKLTEPLHQQISCGIDVAVVTGATSRATPLSFIQPQFIERVPAYRASFARGKPAIHAFQDLAVPVAFVRELPANLAEGDLLHRSGITPARQSSHIQVFNHNKIKFIHQAAGEGMYSRLARIPYSSMRPSDTYPLLLAPAATLLTARQTPLLLTQVPQAGMKVSRIWNFLSGGERRQMVQSQIHPDRPLPNGQHRHFRLGAEAHVVAPGGISRERDHVRTPYFRKGFGELDNAQFGQSQLAVYPSGTHILESQASRETLASETWVARAVRVEVGERRVLITQTLRQSGRGNFRKPFVPYRTLPLRQPTRDVISREGQAALVVSGRTDLERRIPQPAGRAEPAIEQTALCTVWISSNAVTARDRSHTVDNNTALRRSQRKIQHQPPDAQCATPQIAPRANGSSRSCRTRSWGLR